MSALPGSSSFGRSQPLLPSATPPGSSYTLSNNVTLQPSTLSGWGSLAGNNVASQPAPPLSAWQPTTQLSGWGFPSVPRTSFAPSDPPSAATGLFVAEGGPDGPLGFSFEKVENGPDQSFNFAWSVTAVEAGSWAESVGIEVGCVLVRLNGEDVAPMTMKQLDLSLEQIRPLHLLLQKPEPGKADEGGWLPAWGGPPEAEAGNTNEEYYAAVVDVAAKKLNEDYVSDTSKSQVVVPPSVLKLFPMVFLLFSLAVFGMPIFLVLYVGEDMNAKRWFPHITWPVLILPGVYIFTCLVHMLKGSPSKFFVTGSLIGSCIMLLVISDLLLIRAYEKGPMFASVADCMSWGDKRDVEQQWELARSYYATCMNTMAKKGKIKFAAAVAQFRIQDCPDYLTASAQHPDWAYLEQLEVTQQCGGWCTAAPPLWTKGHVQDACSPVVAQVIHDKIVWCLTQVCIYTVITLCVTSMILIGVPPVLKNYGIEW